MADTCKTVRVVCEGLAAYGGFKDINESDLAPGDVLWSEPQATVSPPEPSTAGTADEFATMSIAEARAYLQAMSISFSKQLSLQALRQKCRDALKDALKE